MFFAWVDGRNEEPKQFESEVVVTGESSSKGQSNISYMLHRTHPMFLQCGAISQEEVPRASSYFFFLALISLNQSHRFVLF
jgi:hypothetical protein